MGKSNLTKNDLVKKVFNNTAIPWDAIGNTYVAAHTAAPGDAGDQTTSECTYTGYARVAVSRDAAGWTVSAASASNTAELNFGLCTAGTETITHFSIGTAASGAGQIIYWGAVSAPTIVVNPGISPRAPIGALLVTEA